MNLKNLIFIYLFKHKSNKTFTQKITLKINLKKKNFKQKAFKSKRNLHILHFSFRRIFSHRISISKINIFQFKI